MSKTYEKGTDNIKQVASYVFEDQVENYNNLQVSTWSKKTRHSKILKNGSKTEKKNIPDPTYTNQKTKGSCLLFGQKSDYFIFW